MWMSLVVIRKSGVLSPTGSKFVGEPNEYSAELDNIYLHTQHSHKSPIQYTVTAISYVELIQAFSTFSVVSVAGMLCCGRGTLSSAGVCDAE